ncbi:bifunctional metallophosphatase/5'-nucleotidase [Shewanella intestini]|uniref:Bifunctional metallophosphatase/5'-nucleotidase n=1 Tax=Shewanella intestini TaxID=2017544 RepID=A0ABS5I2Y0_9GAMM|nr:MULTISPECIES: bifunctional metallophosphatase/5'-nucleotidase [Shewanella]MBR9728256.1 bifunctional metallophosphatase/5'-nucleotidase [Shewanella intestini]MRG35721.1 bifunctional metallophosphatase/5'-nucleotidase [Shewanella sp. XMDDZSB0408]
MAQTYPLRLAHINDTHSNFEPSRVQFTVNQGRQNYRVVTHSGGYARLAFHIEKARAQAKAANQEFLLLHGGDSFQGTLYFREFQGRANAHLLNLLKPDAMVLGNHEIDAGNLPVKAFLNRIDFPLLAGNMDLSHEDPLKSGRLSGHPMLLDYNTQTATANTLLKPFFNTTLAIVGITLDQMKLIARPDPDTHFIHAIDTTKRTVAQLKKQGIHHIIVLSHLGVDQDRELAAAVDGISLIVGGHSHTLQGDFTDLGLSNMPYGEQVNHTPIVHAGKYAETLGLVDIEFDSKGKAISFNGSNHFMLSADITVSESSANAQTDRSLTNKPAITRQQASRAIASMLEAHPNNLGEQENTEITQIIKTQYRPALDALENNTLTYIPRDFVHTRLPSKDYPHGSELAPWVSRSMYKAARKIDPSIDFALHNAGGVRQDLNKGRLSLADVLGRILPFELPLTLYKIKGQYLVEVIESAINTATNNGVTGTGSGSFPYPYGLKFAYDGHQPKGKRVNHVEVYQNKQWRPLNTQAHYIGVSSSYTASGKEGYDALLHAQWQKNLQSQTLQEAFVDYVSHYGEKINQALTINVQYTSHRSPPMTDSAITNKQ